MKKREILKNNKGYTLAELIIVIAIIAVLTTASFITLGVMHTAKAKEAATIFESELATVSGMAKNKSVDSDLNGTIDSSELEDIWGLNIHKVGNKLYLQRVYYKRKNDGSMTVVALTDSHPFMLANNPNDGKGICLSAYVDIELTDTSGTKVFDTSAGDYTCGIAFNRRGECMIHAGTYTFKKKNGSVITKVQLNPNGSYQVVSEYSKN